MELFQLSKEAKLDLRSIATFTENRWGKAQRNMYIKQLDDAFTLLGENYEAGTACDNIRKGYRKFPQGSHLIFYKLGTTANIFIVRILHKSMDIDSRL